MTDKLVSGARLAAQALIFGDDLMGAAATVLDLIGGILG